MKKYSGLAEFIEYLEVNNELIRIKEYVDPIYEITEITDRISKEIGGGKAILFENTGTDFPVITNMMGSERRIKMVLSIDSFDDIDNRMNLLFKEAMQERPNFYEKLKALKILAEAAKWMPKQIKGKGDCQEVINYDPDLSKLPILKCWPYDGGRFITLPLVHTKSEINGSRNIGMYRMQVFSKNTTGMHWHRHKTGAKHYEEWAAANKKMPVAICIGGDPIYTYAATAPLPDGIDEYILAGFLRNKPVSLVKCITQDIEVPADCDFVIEGFVDPTRDKVVEGPFGDHTGFYSLEDLYPTLEITCITHKKDAIYPATIVGVPPQEDRYIAMATERIFLNPIKFVMAPEVTDLYLPEEGAGHNFAIIKINKTFPGQALKVANALWGAGQMMFCKFIIVVDGSVDLRNSKQLADHILKNYSPQRDSYFSKGPLDVLDHCTDVCGFGGKLCIDATLKLPEEVYGMDIPKSQVPNKLIEFVHPNQSPKTNASIVITIDQEHSTEDIYHAIWLVGGNTDPLRDHKIENNILYLDATNKSKKFPRRWPNIVTSSSKIIEAIDLKWESYGIGKLIKSPSLDYEFSIDKGSSSELYKNIK